MAIQFNYTDAGRTIPDEESDCVVRAFALLANITYSDAHRLFAKYGRKPRQGADLAHIIRVFDLHKIYLTRGGITLSALQRKYPKGRIFVLVDAHAFAMIDGVVHDTIEQGGNRRVYSYAVFPSDMWVEDTEAQIRKNAIWYLYQSIIQRGFGFMPSHSIIDWIQADTGYSYALVAYYVRCVFTEEEKTGCDLSPK